MVTHVGTQTIETERLLLRRFAYSDIDSMLRNWIADEQTQWDYGESNYVTPEAVRELFDTKYIVSYSKEDYYRWAVIEKGSQECIGQIAYFSVDTENRHGEIEYVIGPAFQGKGYATEMTKAVISFGFEKINFNRIEIDCRTENEASRRVIEKCGLTYEGVFRDFFWRKDHFEGRRVFSILKSEWNASVKKSKRDRAIEYFAAKMHCSQAVLAAFSEECGISEEQAFKLGSCFGSGMRKGDVCGACTGALMVLGLLYGETHMGDPEERNASNRFNDMMMDRFRKANGSYICNDLLGHDVSTPEGAQKAREEGLFTELCPKMVASAVDILEEIIAETEHT